ncbi:MAG: type II secretion system protein [Candidatus Nomurabacteria bacterium]|nr:MAG: type II secretion system protein [Candidatus Nomurabacteria bacterium]
MRINKQNGFTIVELLIASAVFSFVILGASVAIIQISRLYYKGIIVSNTQTSAKAILDSITQAIQYESATIVGKDDASTVSLGDAPTTNHDVSVVCIGNNRFTFVKGVKQGSDTDNIKHAMWRDKIDNSGACSTGVPDLKSDPSAGHDMLSDNMRVSKLEVNALKDSVGNETGLYEVKLTVIYGDDDLIDGDKCKGQVAGSQWCSAVNYSTIVFKRIK